MSPVLLLSGVLAYFLILLAVAHRASRRAGTEGFYVGGRQSPWPVVAFGMIGTSLSGVTFISVPGAVAAGGFGYLQVTLGYVVGYVVIAFVLLPHYHRLGLASIYELLGERLGPAARRLGSAYFVLSRTVGATARLYLVVQVLHTLILGPLGLPFALGAAVVLAMILLYTVEGGVKALVWTDTLQTAGMLTGLVVCTALLWRPDAFAQLDAAGLTRVWVSDPLSRDFSAKALLAGAFIAIAMTGLDQEMMQKSLSVAKLRDAQKNLLLLAGLLVVVIGAFLLLGGLLTLYAREHGIAARGDALFPTVVMQHLPAWVQAVFVLALVSALLPSADGALTALTASTCLDLLRIPREDVRTRRRVHLAFAALFLAMVLGFKALASASMIYLILKLAGYTYGPLLGLFAFALFTPRVVSGRVLLGVCIAAPLLCAVLDLGQPWGGYQIGLELLVLNGLLTWAGLLLAHRRL
ncbi:sodium:solute symporter [Roseateles saccharophilus]|uniref:Na+/proline symporter n=1 Tax=Roseateles saccharophilus TaxID=304 RepID=A0A4R3VGU1_ROSSA|nr:sodium:solute symporter [Roseateles saccharophilus]MDG0832993.1 sodium:solute symporter [Roseateles saccharophilus]TCV02085.1 Na+/proline symporter [Roseateles saccharophilus]